ncbi:MAG: CHAT domain-containing protein [Halobacteriota archaeon]
MPAGVKTLVMSLWSVPGEATKELMVDFYRRTLEVKGVPQHSAMHSLL